MRVPYVVALTLEPDTIMLSKKIRVLLVRRDILANIHSVPAPELESERHSVRWDTLLKMAEAHFPENAELINKQRRLTVPGVTAGSPVGQSEASDVRERDSDGDDSKVTLGSLHRPKAGYGEARFMEVELSFPLSPGGVPSWSSLSFT
jgi:hypothetical protein